MSENDPRAVRIRIEVDYRNADGTVKTLRLGGEVFQGSVSISQNRAVTREPDARGRYRSTPDVIGIQLSTSILASPSDCEIVVNGKKHRITEEFVSYDDIVQLAELPKRAGYSITCKIQGGPGAILSPGKTVMVHNGMVFNIADTSNA